MRGLKPRRLRTQWWQQPTIVHKLECCIHLQQWVYGLIVISKECVLCTFQDSFRWYKYANGGFGYCNTFLVLFFHKFELWDLEHHYRLHIGPLAIICCRITQLSIGPIRSSWKLLTFPISFDIVFRKPAIWRDPGIVTAASNFPAFWSSCSWTIIFDGLGLLVEHSSYWRMNGRMTDWMPDYTHKLII